MAAAALSDAERQLPQFRGDLAFYNGSENVFRVVCMVRVIQKFGVLYNTAKIPAEVPFDTADTFLHGALLGEGGTCASLPVVPIAVGRRRGYPLELGLTHRHFFCR